jgi:butyrate kinase
MKILAINPGGLSTKIALYEDRHPVWTEDIQHSEAELKGYESVLEQFDFRHDVILKKLEEKGTSPQELAACVGRGGLLRSLEAGTYRVGPSMLEFIREGRTQADHPSNLGALLAHSIAEPVGIPAFIADPVSVDQFEDVARVSGFPGIERLSLHHPLNVRATAFKLAEKRGCAMADLNLVVAHLGSGFSICPLRKGRIIDVNNANDGGPLSPMRVGTLPTTQLVKLAFSGKYASARELNNVLTKKGGLVAYLGTHDLREVMRRIEAGDEFADLIFRAMIYQVCKEVGAMAAVLDGEVDAVVLTGGLAYGEKLAAELVRRLSWIAPVEVFAGENELEALVMASLRVLRGEEEAREY